MAGLLTDIDPSLLDAREVAALLVTDPERGLTGHEAKRRLVETGPNELTAAEPVPVWRRLLAQVQDPLVYLLLVATAISLVAWLVEGHDGWPFDAIVILVIVVANAVLGYVQERRAEDAVAMLQRLSAATAAVIRDGELERIPARAVVPGDLLVLAEGDTVAADARLLTASLTVAEASLTGESEPVLKDPTPLPDPVALGDRLDMVFAGTAVTRGTGRAVVTATGMSTETGQIARLLDATESEPTPLQREIAHVGKMLGIAVLVVAVVVVVAVTLTSDVRTLNDAVTVLLLGVSLAVAAVPEGLPAILSVVLALGVQRMAARHAIVKNLSSVETLGSASVICSDKTGTLTQNEMTIERVVTASGEAHLSGSGYDPTTGGVSGVGGAPTDGDLSCVGGAPTDGDLSCVGGALDPDGALWWEVAAVLSGGSLANDALLRRDANGDWGIEGDPTDAAFLVAERKLGTTAERTRRFERVGDVPFSSDRKLMSALAVDVESDDRIVVVTKGAPDVLLDRCTQVLVGRKTVPLDDERRATVLAAIDRLSGEALRTLGVAFRVTDDDVAPQVLDPEAASAAVEHHLVLAGVVGMIDPARPEARAAVAAAHSAGIKVVMITGDHPRTAARIASDLGIVDAATDPGADRSATGEGEPARAENTAVLTGLELERLDDDALRAAVRHTAVFARVSPEHKLRIVDALQAGGHVVAMTGDGVNDSPALRAADIGVAMGLSGTEVARGASTMILADDNFATIVEAVREGRGIFDNIKRFLRYLLSSNIGEVLTVFFGVMLAGALGLTGHGEAVVLPLLATQILWINLLTDTAPALAMGVEPQSEDVMARWPRRPTDRLIDAQMWASAVFIGAVMAAATLLTIDLYLPGGLIAGSADLTTARTAGFTVLVVAQLFNALNARSDSVSAFHRLFANRWLWGAIALSLVLQVAVVHLSVLNDAFATTPLSVAQWAVCVAMASSVLWASELRKVLVRVVGSSRTGNEPDAG